MKLREGCWIDVDILWERDEDDGFFYAELYAVARSLEEIEAVGARGCPVGPLNASEAKARVKSRGDRFMLRVADRNMHPL